MPSYQYMHTDVKFQQKAHALRELNIKNIISERCDIKTIISELGHF